MKDNPPGSVINRDGMMIELPAFSDTARKAEADSDRYSKPKTKITKSQRETLRMKFGGKCAYCGCELPEKGWHADHVEPIRRDFDIVYSPRHGAHISRSNGKALNPELHAIENLFPACAPCNLFKATSSIEGMRKEIARQTERARAYSVNFRTAERFGLIKVTDKPVVFWFEVYRESNNEN